MLSRRDLTGVGAQYDMDHLKGYQVTADLAAINEIAASPEVDYVEKDGIVTASTLTSQTGAPYGLGRISHRNQDSTTYIYDSTAGSGITVYVVDTGIYTAHSQFGGRASFGANYISGSAVSSVCAPYPPAPLTNNRTLMRTDTEPIALAQSQAAPMVSQRMPSSLPVSPHILGADLPSPSCF